MSNVAQEKMPEGYQQSEVGIIPEDWNSIALGSLARIQRGASPRPIDSPIWFDQNSKTGWLRISDVSKAKKYLLETTQNLSHLGIENSRPVVAGSLVMSICATVGRPILTGKDVCIHDGFVVFNSPRLNKNYLYYVLLQLEKSWGKHGQTGSQMNLNTNLINSTHVAIPSLDIEQDAIARALSDVDDLIVSLEKLIAKKRDIKTATMQQLLTGKKRLPPFDQTHSGYKQTELGEIPEDWEVFDIKQFADCLDHLRVPLNELQRSKIKGDIPYCGANGVVGSVNDYVVDDDIILIAEDGGYFDEYATRPIAYRMIGKCWVNNHAHILKAKEKYSQSFLFYSLVHKDIQKYLASGTRAKLNKSEMEKVSFVAPCSKSEQDTIGNVFDSIDNELDKLVERLNKTQQLKQGMMQELLTGKTRLI